MKDEKKLLFWRFYILKKSVIQLEEKKLASENKNMGLVRPACKKTLRALLCYLNWPQTLTHSSNLFFCVFLFCTTFSLRRFLLKQFLATGPCMCAIREREREKVLFLLSYCLCCASVNKMGILMDCAKKKRRLYNQLFSP